MSNLPNIVNERLTSLGCAIAGTSEYEKFASTPAALKDQQQAALYALVNTLRACWPTPNPPLENKTRQDAIARVARSRNGCLVDASPEYLVQLVYQLNRWLDLIQAEQRRQSAARTIKNTLDAFEQMEEELHEEPEPEF